MSQKKQIVERYRIVNDFVARKVPSMEKTILRAGTLANLTGRIRGGRKLSFYSRTGIQYTFLVEENDFISKCSFHKRVDKKSRTAREVEIVNNIKLYPFI